MKVNKITGHLFEGGLCFGPAMSLCFHYAIAFKSVLVNLFADVFSQSSNKVATKVSSPH